MNKALLLELALLLLAACAVIPPAVERPDGMPVACTEEAKICPDGSAVGRVPPSCEFAPCPDKGRDYCEADEDCICQGIDTQTGDCFVGNKHYYEIFVNKDQDCPDFCTGIAGNLVTRCVKNKCQVVPGEPRPVGPSLEIEAKPQSGEAPLSVNFTAILRNAEEQDARFACAAQRWDFGDGDVWMVPFTCDAAAVQTRYEAYHKFEKPGMYEVTFMLGELASKPAVIAVLPELLPPECDEDSDCVPAQCCHAGDCIITEKRPDCSKVFCTRVCMPGTLDCGGRCACVAGRCTGQDFYQGPGPSGKVPWQALP